MEVTGRSAASLEILARAPAREERRPPADARGHRVHAGGDAESRPGVVRPAVVSRGELIPRATTGEPPLLLDQLQQKLGDGPCINAAKHQCVFRIEDTREDLRWPQFRAAAAQLNVRSMLCVPLWIDERGLGALSLYADEAAAFNDLHERVTTLLATFAALALAEAQHADQMHDALGNRDVIGQAKGVLMERHGITADVAFSVLSRISQAENLKVAEIARRFVETGRLPDGTGPEGDGAMP